MASEIRPYESISLKQCGELIKLVGHKIVVMVQGEMGIGKSRMLKTISHAFPDHIPCYVDMTTKDVGDLLAPKFVNIDGMDVCSFIPNAEFGLQFKRPLIIMWDEFPKANKTVQTQCIRALQEWQLGEHKFPEGTIQFGTGNTTAEGLGDALMPHHQNRIMQVHVRKPTAKEWIEDFAIDNNVHPTIIQAVNELPQMLASWQDYKTPGENPYIHDPRKPQPVSTTPRSLEKASDLLHLIDTEDAQTQMPAEVVTHALAGLLGPTAAADIMSVHALFHKLASWEEVMEAPDKARLPDSAGAQYLFVYAAIMRLDKDTIGKLMVYIRRMRKEAQALFATTAIATGKAGVVTADPGFFAWAEEHRYMYSTA